MSPKPPEIPPDHRILFLGRDRERFGSLSHFHPAPIVLDGETWPTVEHYYQTQKSFDPAYRQAVKDAATPGEAKRLAAYSPARVLSDSWFQRNGTQPRPDWQEVKLEIMRRADLAKFLQNPELAECLLATGDAELIEDAPSEPFWGIGADGTGLNWAGRILMEIRERLRTAAAAEMTPA